MPPRPTSDSDLIGTDGPADRLSVLLVREPLRGDVHGRIRSEVAGALVGVQQRVHFVPQVLVSAAGAAQKRRPFLARQFQRGVKQLADPLVLLGIHAWPLSSRKSHACARLQSRLTVPTDTSRTCATSSRLNPPKKRSSMTRL